MRRLTPGITPLQSIYAHVPRKKWYEGGGKDRSIVVKIALLTITKNRRYDLKIYAICLRYGSYEDSLCPHETKSLIWLKKSIRRPRGEFADGAYSTN